MDTNTTAPFAPGDLVYEPRARVRTRYVVVGATASRVIVRPVGLAITMRYQPWLLAKVEEPTR